MSNAANTATAPERSVNQLIVNAQLKAKSLPTPEFQFSRKLRKPKVPNGYQALPVSKRTIERMAKADESPSVTIAEALNQPQAVDKLMRCPICFPVKGAETVMIWVPNDFGKMARQVYRYASREGLDVDQTGVSGTLIHWLMNESYWLGPCIDENHNLCVKTKADDIKMLTIASCFA